MDCMYLNIFDFLALNHTNVTAFGAEYPKVSMYRRKINRSFVHIC